MADRRYHEAARCLTIDAGTRPSSARSIAILAAGTSDLPVAEEAAVVAEFHGAASSACMTSAWQVSIAFWTVPRPFVGLTS